MNRNFFMELLDEGNIEFGWFEEQWNQMLDDLQLLNNVNHLSDYSEYVLRKLKKIMLKYRKYYILFDIDTGREIIIDEIENFGPELIYDAITQGFMTNEYWTNFNTLGDVSSTGQSKVNYSGFGLTNQQGQYSGTENKSTSTGTTARLQHIAFLQSYTSKKCDSFVERLKSKLFQLIY